MIYKQVSKAINIKRIVTMLQKKLRAKRAKLFRKHFTINNHTKILDLGSDDGSHINSIINGYYNFNPKNIYIADINRDNLKKGEKKYNYTPVFMKENEKIPFPDKFFDIVFCSSVIEHVTIPKKTIWNVTSTKTFRDLAFKNQIKFANEIRRLSKYYFVQVPNKYFIIESHTWLPFISYLPRPLVIRIIKLINKFWIKKTQPDFNLLTKKEMKKLFPESIIYLEKFLFLNKSIMAISS